MTTPAPTVGQFTTSPLAGVQVAATQIAASSQTTSETAGLIPSLRQATVITRDVTTPPTATVTFDGVTNTPGVGYVTPFFPMAGDVVNCFVLNGVTWITEKIAQVATHGINAWTGTRVATTNIGWGTWITIGGLTGAAGNREDDGTIYASPEFTSSTAGNYLFSMTVSFDSAVQTTYGVRWVSPGGSVVACRVNTADDGTNPWSLTGTAYLPAAYSIHPQMWQSTGGLLTIPGHASATPQTFSYALLG